MSTFALLEWATVYDPIVEQALQTITIFEDCKPTSLPIPLIHSNLQERHTNLYLAISLSYQLFLD